MPQKAKNIPMKVSKCISSQIIMLYIPTAIRANGRLARMLQLIAYFVGLGGPARSRTITLTGTMVNRFTKAMTIPTLARSIYGENRKHTAHSPSKSKMGQRVRRKQWKDDPSYIMIQQLD